MRNFHHGYDDDNDEDDDNFSTVVKILSTIITNVIFLHL